MWKITYDNVEIYNNWGKKIFDLKEAKEKRKMQDDLVITIIDNEPYGVSDLEISKDGSYEKGYEDGTKVNDGERGSVYYGGYGDGYKDGLNEAWECARKIVLGVADGGISIESFNELFGMNYYEVMKNYSASEAIAKIKEYEEKKNQAEFEIGDEVVGIYGEKGYVTGIDEIELCVLYPDGTVGHSSKQTYQKTGIKDSRIVELLEKMKGKQNEQ